MVRFKNLQFAKGEKLSLADFKKDFAPILKGLSMAEVKQAHKLYNGNAKPSKKQRKEVKES